MTPTLDPCATRHGGNPESTEAFKRVDALTDRKEILDLIKSSGERGMTLDEASAILSRPPNQISGRFSELKMRNQIRATEDRRRTRTGSFARVYKSA